MTVLRKIQLRRHYAPVLGQRLSRLMERCIPLPLAEFFHFDHLHPKKIKYEQIVDHESNASRQGKKSRL